MFKELTPTVRSIGWWLVAAAVVIVFGRLIFGALGAFFSAVAGKLPG
jgi:hypothetical protein